MSIPRRQKEVDGSDEGTSIADRPLAIVGMRPDVSAPVATRSTARCRSASHHRATGRRPSQDSKGGTNHLGCGLMPLPNRELVPVTIAAGQNPLPPQRAHIADRGSQADPMASPPGKTRAQHRGAQRSHPDRHDPCLRCCRRRLRSFSAWHAYGGGRILSWSLRNS
jgi:hypothetical protein